MTTAPKPQPSPFVWTRATWFGWLLGVPSIALLALLGEVLGIGGSQTLVGAGMGAGVGLLQGTVLRRSGVRLMPWVGACVIGLALPFLVWDIAKAVGTHRTYSLFLCVTAGGLIAGILQATLLRARVPPTWWVLASTLGWGLAGGLATSADTLLRAHSIRGLAGAGLYLGLITSGGIILGVVTGLVLSRHWRTTAV
jgi:hypothetical protein